MIAAHEGHGAPRFERAVFDREPGPEFGRDQMGEFEAASAELVQGVGRPPAQILIERGVVRVFPALELLDEVGRQERLGVGERVAEPDHRAGVVGEQAHYLGREDGRLRIHAAQTTRLRRYSASRTGRTSAIE